MPPLQEELTDLAASGAKPLAAAVGRDLWPTVRRVARRMLIRTTGRRTGSSPTPAAPSTVHQQNTAHSSGHIYASQCGSQHIYVLEPQDAK